MSVARTARRRRAQAANGFMHLPPRQRPGYKKAHFTNIGDAIAAEKRKADRMRAASTKKAK
jgi:hypothetical protein